jgi:hypothetical protein
MIVWGHPEQEFLMRRTFTIVAIADLVLAGIVKLVAAPSRTVAAADDLAKSTISIQDLHAEHPGVKTLPVDVVPQP